MRINNLAEAQDAIRNLSDLLNLDTEDHDAACVDIEIALLGYTRIRQLEKRMDKLASVNRGLLGPFAAP